jgi:hypothetical protein
MQYILTLKTDTQAVIAPPPELMAALGKLTEEMTKSGVLVQTGGMQSQGASLKLSSGKVTVTDGPFTESKELVGGYAIVDVKSEEEALELGRRFLQIHARIMGPSFRLESEVRRMYPVSALRVP